MKNKIHILIISFLAITNLFSQNPPTFQWVKTINSTSSTNDSGVNGVATDASGNVVTTGWFKGTVPFGPSYTLTSTGNNDFFIAKYNSGGTLLWAQKFGSAASEIAYDIKVDNNSNIYVCGKNAFTSGTFDFDPGPGVAIPSPWRSSFIAKYDPNGNYIWAQEALSQYGEMSLTLDKFGNAFCFGTNAYDLNIQKYNNAGVLVGGTGTASNPLGLTTEPGRITCDSTGNVYVAFGFAGTMYCGTFTTSSTGANDIGIIKYNNNLSGSPLWVRKIGGTGNDFLSGNYGGPYNTQIIDIAIDNQQNLCCTSMFVGVVNFGPSTYTAGPTNGDGFLAKFSNATGTCLFVKHIRGTTYVRPSGIRIDANDNIHVTGNFLGNLYCDPTTTTSGTLSAGGMGLSGLFYAKYDINGNYLSNGGIANFSSSAKIKPNNIFINSSSIFLGGDFYGTQDFNMGTGNVSATGTPTAGTGYVAKYDYCSAAPSSPSSISGLNSFCSGAGIQTYSVPPVSGATSYIWSLPGAGWSGTSSTNTISVTTGTTSGNISITANNACGSSSAAVLSVTVNPLPTITVNSGSICYGSSYTMTPSGASTYTFSSGSAIVSPTANASYSVTGTSSAGCVGSNTAVSSVTVNSIPVASASTTQTLTCVNTTATLNGSGVSTYTWSGPGIVSGGNTASPIVNMAGTYSLVGSTSGCNSNTATVSLTSNTIAPSVSVTATSNSICIGNSATLTASGASTYSWGTSSTATSIVVSPTTTTNYILTGTNSVNGCTNTINNSIGVNPLPMVTANTSASIICGPPFQGTATITASGATTYTWNTTATTTAIVVSPSITTVYSVTGTDANGCVNSTSFTQSVSACTGIDVASTSSATGVNIYPNPTSGIVIIKAKPGLQMRVYNVIGELILNTELKNDTIELDLSDRSNGIYFIRIGSFTRKIIKE